MKVQVKQYQGLWIAGGLLGVLAIGLGVLTFRARSTFADARTRLESAQSSIERLQRAQPFPSRDNVAIATENLQQLRTFRDSLVTSMSQNQFEPLNVEPAAFPLGPALRRLRSAARQHQVELKSGETFGFGRYVADGVPASATNEIGRLTVQLQVIEHVCSVLFSSGIAELEEVRRTTFETPGTGVEDRRATGRRRAAQVDEVDRMGMRAMPVEELEEEVGLFSPERVYVKFRCEPAAVWRVLNAFAADRTFIVISDVNIETDAVEIATTRTDAPARPAGATDPPPGPVPHRERIVAGEEIVTVELALDVYRFQLPDPDEAVEQAAGGTD